MQQWSQYEFSMKPTKIHRKMQHRRPAFCSRDAKICPEKSPQHSTVYACAMVTPLVAAHYSGSRKALNQKVKKNVNTQA